MEFADVVRSRRMTRRFTPDPVDAALVDHIVDLARRGPSAGFAQGTDLLILDDPAARQGFWGATGGDARTRWLDGVRPAPVLVLFLADPSAYRNRYAKPDKASSDQDWSVPYWDVDTGMSAMIALLAAAEVGVGALFFGVPERYWAAVFAQFGIPADRRIVGVIALGHPADNLPSGSARSRTRRADVLHRNGFTDRARR